jgi:hypothetical protein
MARRDKSVPLADARLDDLFEAGDESVSPAPAGKALVLAAIVVIVGVSAVLSVLARAVGLAPPYPLLVAVTAGLVLIRAATVQVRERGWPSTRTLARAPDGPERQPEVADGMLAAIGAWNRRIEPARSTRHESTAGLTRELADLADERLRQRHNVTRSTNPARARALLGDAVWSVLQQTRAPSAAEVSTVVQRLEAL